MNTTTITTIYLPCFLEVDQTDHVLIRALSGHQDPVYPLCDNVLIKKGKRSKNVGKETKKLGGKKVTASGVDLPRK